MPASPNMSNSPASSPGTSPAPALAKRSVKDLLAELSESDSDNEAVRPATKNATKAKSVAVEQDESSDDEVVLGGGRLAARLAGAKSLPARDVKQKEVEILTSGHNVGSEDELSRSPPFHTRESPENTDFMPKRRLLLKRKRSDEEEEQSPNGSSNARPRDASPTPTRSNHSSSPAAARSPAADTTDATAKSKFELLIEKARSERLAREAAEKAKKAARAAERSSSSPKRKIQRGSSPADDSEEDSDELETGSSKKFTKDARPARKASRKALEEMNRETQRMNRNMQLAHQATTKKKFSKQGFFETFGRGLPANSSSAPSSDSENQRLRSTPPTSPMREPETPKHPTAVVDVHPVNAEHDEVLDDVPDLMAILEQRSKEADQSVPTLVEKTESQHAVTSVDNNSDSGSDIEVVADKGSRRKYVAFENLPMRKAQELPSHMVLRALAHVRKHMDKKSSIPTADMGPALLRAARNQAFEERKTKIEKLKAAGVVIQTSEEREIEEEQLEDLVEKARQEDEEIRKREKELAKKEGTYVKDALDDDDSDEEDDDFVGEEDEPNSGSEDEGAENEEDEATDGDDEAENDLFDNAAEESDAEAASEIASNHQEEPDSEMNVAKTPMPSRRNGKSRLIVEDEDEDEDEVQAKQSPAMPSLPKTPHSIFRSARKPILGLEHSDPQPMGLTQAFAATMADSQTQEQDSMDVLRELPSPQVTMVPHLNRLDSLDVISESVPNSQIQPIDLDLGLTQSQCVPESPMGGFSATQMSFDLTQDKGYVFSPFKGDRFAETPVKQPHSTEETVIVPQPEESPMATRKGRLQRGRQNSYESTDEDGDNAPNAFSVIKRSAKQRLQQDFNKKKSEARGAVDEAAEESDDEYAGLGGASEDESGEENEEDRKMIDEDTQVGRGDEAKLAKLYADRERESDEAAVSKLLKDIQTGGLRRKRGAADDLDLSDEEDATARRREAKRREFAKMRRELLKDEAVNKIADDQKKQAFLKSIEDQDDDEEGQADSFDQPETQPEDESQESAQDLASSHDKVTERPRENSRKVLQPRNDSQLNIGAYDDRRVKEVASRKPTNLAEIRDSLSFLIEEPESQSGVVDLGLSDSEEEPEAYVNLARHFQQAEADEEALMDENEDLGDFIVADSGVEEDLEDSVFKKPELPTRDQGRAPFSERRTKTADIVDRLSMIRQSSSTGSNASSKMAFMSGKGGIGGTGSVPSLLRRATTNSGLGSMSGRENVSATGVVTNKTERGSAAQEKDFVRKGANTSRNAINYQGRQNLKEEKMSARAGVVKKQQHQKKSGSFLNGLFRGDTWG